MRILITGATGNVGFAVAKSLMAFDVHIRLAGTEMKRLDWAKGELLSTTDEGREEKVDQTIFDFLDPSTYESALDGVDRIFFMRPPHIGKGEQLYPFIEYAKKKGVRFIVFLSLMGIEKNPMPPHYRIEKFIEKSGLDYTHIRPGFFMQNLSGIHRDEINNRNEIWIPAGKRRTSFIDAEDIGAAIAAVLIHPEIHRNKSYTITGAEALNYFEVAEILSEEMGRKIQYRNPGLWTFRRRYVKARGLDPAYVNVMVALYLMTRLGTAEKVTQDFQNLTGRKPTSFREFIKKNREAFTLRDVSAEK